jgi:hypothetical protein
MEPSDVRPIGQFGDLTTYLAVICPLGKKPCVNKAITRPMSRKNNRGPGHEILGDSALTLRYPMVRRMGYDFLGEG